MSKARIATVWLDGCSGCHMSLLDMDEKLIMHECAYPNLKAASRELVGMLVRFPETYNREYCVLGFFEAYFEPVPARADGKGEGSTPTETDDTSANDTEDEG